MFLVTVFTCNGLTLVVQAERLDDHTFDLYLDTTDHQTEPRHVMTTRPVVFDSMEDAGANLARLAIAWSIQMASPFPPYVGKVVSWGIAEEEDYDEATKHLYNLNSYAIQDVPPTSMEFMQ